MPMQLSLSAQELELVIDLLARERRELPPEIHHTDLARVKEGLQERLQMVEGLLDRLARVPAR
ncbi:MAG: hypothetical protein ABFD94_15850 [Armatimonadia bacterium]